MKKNMPIIKSIIAIIFIVTICGGIVFAWYDVTSDANANGMNLSVAGVDALEVYMKIEPWGVENPTTSNETTTTVDGETTTTVDGETTTTVDGETTTTVDGETTTTVDGETTTTVDGETTTTVDEETTTTVDGETTTTVDGETTTTVDSETTTTVDSETTTTVDGETTTTVDEETTTTVDGETTTTVDSETTTPEETTSQETTTSQVTTERPTDDGVTKMLMQNINPNSAVVDISLEELTNIEKGMLAPGSYGQIHFYIKNKSVDMNGFDLYVTPKYKVYDDYYGNMEELIDVIESHILFFGEKTDAGYGKPLTIDGTGKLAVDGEYIVGSTMHMEGELEFEVEKEVIVYWYWPYEYGDVPGVAASSINEDTIRKYDLEDTMIGNYLTSFSLHFEVKGKYYD